MTSNIIYLEERGNIIYGSNPTMWTGKVGLMYASDFGYAVGGSMRETCLEKSLDKYGYADYCRNNNWLRIDNNTQWTLSIGRTSICAITIDDSGNSHCPYTYHGSNYYHIRSTIYLNSNTIISSGTGLSTDPIILKAIG